MVSSTGLAMSATGSVDYTGDTPAMALKMTAPELGEGTIDMRLVDQVLYMTMPMFDPSGKFFRIDLRDPDNPLADSLGELRSFDPKSTFAMFGKGAKSVTVVGAETIAGDETTHYRVTTDSCTWRRDSREPRPAPTCPNEFTYEIWLDGDNRMRRLTSDVGQQTSIEMEMTNWGEPVDIAVPPSRPGPAAARSLTRARAVSGRACSAGSPSSRSVPDPSGSGCSTGWRRVP